jgi:hypothetical protein
MIDRVYRVYGARAVRIVIYFCKLDLASCASPPLFVNMLKPEF